MTDDLKKQLARAITDNADQTKEPDGVSQIVVGDNNLQVNGDVIITANQKTVKRVNRLPECDDISAQQKKFIQDKIYQLADREVAKGKTIREARSSWWSRLNNRFYVNSYTCIKQAQFDDVVKWLDQQVGMTRPKLRRTNKTAWRNEHYKGLYAKCRQLKKDKQWLYDQAFEITGKRVTSLKDLNDTNLKKLHQIIFSRHKGTGRRKKASGLVSLIIIALIAAAPLSISQSEPQKALKTYPVIDPAAQSRIQPAVHIEQGPQSFTYTSAPGFQAFAGCSFTRIRKPTATVASRDRHNI